MNLNKCKLIWFWFHCVAWWDWLSDFMIDAGTSIQVCRMCWLDSKKLPRQKDSPIPIHQLHYDIQYYRNYLCNLVYTLCTWYARCEILIYSPVGPGNSSNAVVPGCAWLCRSELSHCSGIAHWARWHLFHFPPQGARPSAAHFVLEILDDFRRFWGFADSAIFCSFFYIWKSKMILWSLSV